jgi:sulfhydrogenase subunit beta (sulfur reductase)
MTAEDENVTQAIADEYLLSRESLDLLVSDLLSSGLQVIAPAEVDVCDSPAAMASAACLRPGAKPVQVDYAILDGQRRLALGEAMPNLSLKGFFLPQNEALLCWRQRGGRVDIEPAPTEHPPRVVLGAKPCDAAALEIVDKVMNWDYADELWNGRRAASTIFTLACPVEDDSCFCAAVGGAPDGTRGADGLLTPVDGGFVVRATTEKGRAFVAAHADRFAPLASAADANGLLTQADTYRAQAQERVVANLQIDAESVRDWVASHFDDPLLAALGVRCNGCGVCSSVCPTCHCFDIVDEPDGLGGGTRRRCWDTCQTGKFTAHASGHNPRATQNARFRQRINHKFAIYPLRFGEVLCTGCGRCARACHAGQDLVEILAAIDVAAHRGAPESATQLTASEGAA